MPDPTPDDDRPFEDGDELSLSSQPISEDSTYNFELKMDVEPESPKEKAAEKEEAKPPTPPALPADPVPHSEVPPPLPSTVSAEDAVIPPVPPLPPTLQPEPVSPTAAPVPVPTVKAVPVPAPAPVPTVQAVPAPAPAPPPVPTVKAVPAPVPVQGKTADIPPPLPTDLTPIISDQPPTANLPVAKRVVPVWQVLEPVDRTDPVPHEVSEFLSNVNGRQVIAASVRGKLHAHKAQWREDSYQCGSSDSWSILAVSDGAGSSRLSRVASRISCEAAVAHLQALLAGYTLAEPDGDQPTDGDLKRIRSFLAEAGEQAWRSILTEAKARSASPKDFYCTLLLVVHTQWKDRDFVAALQVGDGVIGLLTSEGAKTLGTADHGEYSSETKFLTSPGMEHELPNRVLFSLPKSLTALLLATDGVSDDFYPEDKRIGELFSSPGIEGILSKSGEPLIGVMPSVVRASDPAHALQEWLRYEKRGSSDDRTLLLMIHD